MFYKKNWLKKEAYERLDFKGDCNKPIFVITPTIIPLKLKYFFG